MILVTGGAGYIGSHTVLELQRAGKPCMVLDNLSRGHRQAVPEGVPLVVGDIADEGLLSDILATYRVDTVMHFAADSLVAESMAHPGKYFRNNVGATAVLLDVCSRMGVKNIIFSSSAAVYGNPVRIPVDEECPTEPVNVYGQTKLMIEQMLFWYQKIYGMQYISLRYFNAAGADPGGNMGEDHSPETHLIPNILSCLLTDSPFNIYGNDYDTDDGTCVRDYVHVCDLADAHVKAYQYLNSGGASGVFNLGTGRGFSIQQVVAAVEQVTGKRVTISFAPRRDGDPPYLVASGIKAREVLRWEPKYDLNGIISTAWRWHRNHPSGFGC